MNDSPSLNYEQPYIERLYPKEQISKAFYQSLEGSCQAVCVSGAAGVGKTTLVQKTIESLLSSQTYFAFAKSSKSDSDSDYNIMCNLLNQFIQHKLTESKDSVEAFKKVLHQEMFNDIELLSRIIPDLNYILKSTVKHIDNNPKKLHARVQNCLIHVLKILLQSNHHLVLFIDDLQWVDDATLNMLQVLLKKFSYQPLFIICAVRTDEIKKNSKFDNINQSFSLFFKVIPINKFDLQMTNQYVCQYFRCTSPQISELSKEIYIRSLGNPLYILHLVKELDKKVCRNQADVNCYLNLIRDIENDFLSLIQARIYELSDDMMYLLKLAACIGYQFDYELLLKISNFKESLFNTMLNCLCEKSIIINKCTKTSYCPAYKNAATQYEFYHDTIYNFLYKTIEPAVRQDNHLAIARYLVNGYNELSQKNELYQIANHYNLANEKVINDTEKDSVIYYNEIAGQHAKSVAAYKMALGYFNKALSLMPDNSWQQNYQKTYQLHSDIIDCYCYLNYDLAEQLITDLFEKAKHKSQKVALYYKAMLLYDYSGKYLKSIAEGKKALRLLDIKIPDKRYELSTMLEVVRASSYFKNDNLENIFSKQYSGNEHDKMCLEILSLMSPAANLVDQDIVVLILLKLANLSAKYGVTGYAYIGYASYCVVLANVLGRYKKAEIISKKIHQAVANIGEIEIKCQTECILAGFVDFYYLPLSQTIKQLEASFKIGTESTEHLFGVYSLAMLLEQSYSRGGSLLKLSATYQYYTKDNDYKFIKTVNNSLIMIEEITNSLSNINYKTNFYTENSEFEQRLLKEKTNDIVNYYLYQAQEAFYFGQIDIARKTIDKAIHYINTAKGFFFYCEVFYYYFLIYADVFNTLSAMQKTYNLTKMKSIIKKYKAWSSACPKNFMQKYYLLLAEYNRITKKTLNAASYYDKAIEHACKNGFLQDQAIANHLAANYYCKYHNTTIAALYYQQAYDCFEAWGAFRICEFYQQHYAVNFKSDKPEIHTLLDTAINSEKEIDQHDSFAEFFQKLYSSDNHIDILESFLNCICQLADARKGYIFIEKEDALYLSASCPIEQRQKEQANNIALSSLSNIPKGMLRYTMRTYHSAMVDHNHNDTLFKLDPYVKVNNLAMASYPLFLNLNYSRRRVKI